MLTSFSWVLQKLVLLFQIRLLYFWCDMVSVYPLACLVLYAALVLEVF